MIDFAMKKEFEITDDAGFLGLINTDKYDSLLAKTGSLNK